MILVSILSGLETKRTEQPNADGDLERLDPLRAIPQLPNRVETTIMSSFLSLDPTLENYWRSVILFGQNVASYKFALAKSLIELSAAGNSSISLETLAKPFSKAILDHLAQAPKQATSASSRFLDSCREFSAGKLTEDELIGSTTKLGFQNVIDAFHVVNRDEIPVRFFKDDRKTGGGITLTDNLFRLAERIQHNRLRH